MESGWRGRKEKCGVGFKLLTWCCIYIIEALEARPGRCNNNVYDLLTYTAEALEAPNHRKG